jgi:hypothetical protein
MFAVQDNDSDYKKDWMGKIRVFSTVEEARLYFTVGHIGFDVDPDDDTVLLYRGKKNNMLKIVPYTQEK